MSIARAFTTRRVKQSLELKDAAELVQRSNTTSKTGNLRGSIRPKISGPVELISTTNMLSYNAPDIYPRGGSSSGNSSTKSDDESDALASTPSTPPTSPDSPHPHVSTKRATAEPNHLSSYFTAPGQPANRPAPSAPSQAPVIPQRAPSHTKKASESLSRSRSNSHLSQQSGRTVSSKPSFSFSRASSTSTNTSTSSRASAPFTGSKTSPHPPPTATLPPPPPVPAAAPAPAIPAANKEHHHPFGHELAQVSELAEEYQPKMATVLDEEERELRRKGLNKFSAVDYIGEIQPFFASMFGTGDAKPVRPMWI